MSRLPPSTRATARKSAEVTLSMNSKYEHQQEARAGPSTSGPANLHQSPPFPSPPPPPLSPPPEPSFHASESEAEPPNSTGLPKREEQAVTQTDGSGTPQCRFIPGIAKEMIGSVLREKLTGATYNPDTAPLWVRDITDTIKARLKEMDLDRYKLVVQAVLGEQRGQGFQMSCRCFWDPNTDNYAHESFTNDSIFCVAGAFALYMY